MKKVKWLGAITVLSGAALTLTACGNNNNNNASDKKVSFKEAVPKKQVKKGGTLKYAIESDSPFTGIFLPELSDTSTDSEIQAPGVEGLFSVDDSYKINNKGAATFKLDKNAKTITIEVKKGVKWSDGKQVTAKDLEYAYEIVGNPKTKTSRYTDSLANLVGL
jgi:peptide/nickel transport system substrate-binding protein